MFNSMSAASNRGVFQTDGDDEDESKPSPVYMLTDSDSDPSTDPGESDPGESDPGETDSESEAEAEASESHTDALTTPTDPHRLKTAGSKGLCRGVEGEVEGSYRTTTSTSTQPQTDGDLRIHSVLECGCEVMTCQFNNEGTLLAVGLSDGTIKLYSPDSGRLVKSLRDRTSTLFTLPVTALRFTLSPQAHCLLLATYASGSVRCWYVWGGDLCLWGLREDGESGGGEGGEGGQRQTLSLAVSPSGERAATGGSDSALHLYDLTTHQRLMTCKASSTRTLMDGHRFRVFAVTFHPEREREFISGGWDNTVQFWDSRQQHSVRMFSGPHVCGDALHIDPDVNHILVGSWRKGGALEIWDYVSGRKVCEAPHDPQGESKIYSCQWLGPDHMVAAGSQANMLRVINRRTMVTEARLQGLSSAVFSSSVCPAGRWAGLIAAASGARVLLLERGGRRPSERQRGGAGQEDERPSGVGML